MSDKFLFQNAKIKHMETKLLSSQNVQRLLDCSKVDEAQKALLEFGFGAGLSLENSIDSIFEVEEQNAIAVLKDMNVGGALDTFLIESDYLNLKALLKAQALNNKVTPVLMPFGIYEVDTLKAAISTLNKELVPSYMIDAIEKINRLIQDGIVTPHTIDTIVDKAMYENILSLAKKDKALKDYYVQKIDYLNILSFLRVRKLSLDVHFFEESFVDGGKLALNMFENIFEAPIESLKEIVKASQYEDIVTKVVDSNDLVAFEVSMDNALLKMWKDNFNDMFSIAPIVSYYITKKTEIKLAKLIVAGIKNKVDANLIKERMREIYA